MLGAVILAAGDSTRMGSPKALLLDRDGRPFVARLVRMFADPALAGCAISPIVVVTGRQHEAVVAALAADAAPVTPLVVRNPAPERGQLSSLWMGMDALADRPVAGLLMTLVDVPMTRPETVRSVIAAWQASGAGIVRPQVGCEHGHPVLFDRRLFQALRAASLEHGAKPVVRTHGALNVDVDDPGCVIDVDTPEAYRALIDGMGR